MFTVYLFFFSPFCCYAFIPLGKGWHKRNRCASFNCLLPLAPPIIVYWQLITACLQPLDAHWLFSDGTATAEFIQQTFQSISHHLGEHQPADLPRGWGWDLRVINRSLCFTPATSGSWGRVRFTLQWTHHDGADCLSAVWCQQTSGESECWRVCWLQLFVDCVGVCLLSPGLCWEKCNKFGYLLWMAEERDLCALICEIKSCFIFERWF